MDKQQLLRDANIELTSKVIAEGLGKTNNAYIHFMEEIKTHDIAVKWRYYNDANAWLGKGLYKWITSRGTAKETTTCWISIWDGFFKVGFTFPERCRTEVMELPLSIATKEMLMDAKQVGKMKIFSLGFELCTEELFNDIYTLIEFKKTLK